MRQTVLDLEESKIREVANAGFSRGDVLPFWFGESDEATPDFIRQAAIASLERGETFYAHNLGLPELREAIAGYASHLHGDVAADRIAVTSGGVNALMLACQAVVDAGDEVVAVTPVWPNLTAQALIMGAGLRRVSLQPKDGAWTLDLQALLDAITPATRLLIVNAPNNPTGWTLTREEQQAILAHCRATGTWILADEVYERLYYEPTANRCAPSFLDVAQPDDRLIVAHLKSCRDTLVPLLQGLPGVELTPAKGGMYAFFRLQGQDDSLALAKRLVAEAGIGLAPGNAFAPEAQGWLRWCFASKDLARLGQGVDRLATWLEKA